MARPRFMTPDERLWAPEFQWTQPEPTIAEILASIDRIIHEDDGHTTAAKPTCLECSILRSRITGLEFEISALRDLVRSLTH